MDKDRLQELSEELSTTIIEQLNSLFENENPDEGFDFRSNNQKMTFNPNNSHNADTRIFNKDGEFNVKKILLPKSRILSYNLYDFIKLDINKALKHKKNASGKDVDYGTYKSDSSEQELDSIEYFIKRSAQYIKSLLGNKSIDYITYPQTSKNQDSVGFTSFNDRMSKEIRKLYPNSAGIRFVPELLVKNIRNLYVNVDVAKQLGMSSDDIYALLKSVQKWKEDEDIRDVRKKLMELTSEIEYEKKNRGRGRPNKQFMNKVAEVELIKQQIQLMRTGKRGRDATIDKETGKIKEWQIKSLSDETRRAIEGLFEINPKYKEVQYKLKDKSIVLFDDNISSGATLDDACLALQRLGVKNIYVFTIAVISPTIYAPSLRKEHNIKKLTGE